MAEQMDDLEKAKLLYAAKVAHQKTLADPNAPPGVKAMGNDDGPTTAEKEKEVPLSKRISNVVAGAAQGATGGYMPQLVGGADAAAAGLGNLKDRAASAMGMPGVVSKDFNVGKPIQEVMGDQYLKSRDQELKALEGAKKENPYAYTGAELGGGAATALMLPGGTAKNSTRLARVLKAIGGGALIGAAQNPGDKEGVIDPVQAAERGKNAGIGGVTGGVITGGAEGISSVAPKALEQLANSQAFKALGPYARDVKRALMKDTAQSIGATALDEGVVGGLPTSFKGIAERAAKAKAARGVEVGDTLNRLAAKEGPEGASISRKDIAEQLRQELIEPHSDVASVADKNAKLNAAIDHFEQGGESPITSEVGEHIPLLEAEMKKRALDQNINWKRLPQDDVPVAEQGDKALRAKLAKAVEDKARQLEPDTADNFVKAKEAYGNLDKAEQLSKGKAAHEIAKQLLAPTVGGLYGFNREAHSPTERLKNTLSGMAAGYALRGAQLYGPQIVAPLAKRASIMAPSASKLNPWLAPTLATQGE